MKRAEHMNLKETDVYHAHAYRDGIYKHEQNFKKAKEQYPFFNIDVCLSFIYV